MTYINKTKPEPCDQERTLYELNENKLYKGNRPAPVKGKLSNCHESECERPFSVTMIPHTNMILIVADRLCPCFSNKISIEPQKIEYGAGRATYEMSFHSYTDGVFEPKGPNFFLKIFLLRSS